MVHQRHRANTDRYGLSTGLDDALTNSLANDLTPPERRKSIVALDLPVEAQPSAPAQGLPLLADIKQNTNSIQVNSLALISPTPNTIYRITPNLNFSAQQLSVEAVAGQNFSKVTFYVDGKALAIFLNPPYQTWWNLSAGNHSFWAEGTTTNGENITSGRIIINVLP